MRKIPLMLAILGLGLAASGCDSGTGEEGSMTSGGSSTAAAPAAAGGTPGAIGTPAECRPASEDCPVQTSDEGVTSTDSLPLGSTVRRDEGGPTIDESDYPTSTGSGSVGSGVTGVPAGPDPGPTIGTGR